MEEQTVRGYPLPHKDNIASQDVMRIREALEKIDQGLSETSQGESELQKKLEKHLFEQQIGLWEDPYGTH